MADLVLGVAKSLVEGTLARAQSAIEEESQLRNNTRRDLVFITGEFQMMQSYLGATTLDNVKSSVASTWVTQLRDLAYDVEDGIEFIVHLDTKRRDWWLRVIPSLIAPARPLDEAVDIIKQLKARVQDMRERSSHYNLITDDSGPKPAEEKKLPAFEARDLDLEVLTNLITKKTPHLQVISLWVPGGNPEAVSTIKAAYDNPNGWGNFPCRAWVKAAKSATTQEFVETLLQQFDFKGSGVMNTNQTQTLAPNDYLVKMLEIKKYLVVLEDVSTSYVWETISSYFPDKGNGSRIVVITQQFQMATLCTGHPYISRFWTDFSLCVLYKEGPLIGRGSEIEEFTEYPARARMNALHVISVWGMAGTGKSALVRNLYDKKAFQRREFQKHGWVDASHPFDLRAICQSLFLQFKSHSPQTDEDVVKACRSILKYHSCLVVIDNVQSKEDWNVIEHTLAVRSSASIVIVITNEESIALHCANNRKEFLFNVKALEATDAINLFKSEVAGDECLANCDVEKNRVLQPLISMCGGLPKVLVAISDYLGHQFNWSPKAKELNDKFILSLETRPEFTCLRNLFPWIHHYFRSCPDYLKPCMFYLSIFPKSHIIRRRRLVMRWIAEGYSKDKASGTAEDNGEDIFTKIIELSMIQPEEQAIVTSMRMVRCQVSAFFQEYIITRPKEENVTFALEVFSLEGRCCQTTGRTGRHLVIQKGWERDKLVFDTIDFSRLRSLTVFGEWESFFISESMKVLRVLDLENASGVKNKDLKTMLKRLPRLKFLSLRGCSKISCLPDSVGDLRQLQILDVRYTSITSLPESITRLKKLQYLRAGQGNTAPPGNESAPCTVAFKLPQIRRYLKLIGVKVESGVGNLTTLHTLGVVDVGGAWGKGILNELKNLTQLRKIGVSGVCRKNKNEVFAAISNHSHLRSLSVWLKKNNQDTFCDMPTKSKPPKELQSLKLYGPVEKLPTWIKQLNSIKKLYLELDTISVHDIKVLGDLNELCILHLLVKQTQVEFCVKIEGEEEICYRKIKVLEITSGSNLHLTIGSQAMGNLELLKVRSSKNGLKLQFDGLKYLFKLKRVRINCFPDQKLRQHLEDLFHGCPNKPVFNLEEDNGNAWANVSISGHNNSVAATRGETTSTGGSNNDRATTGGNEHPHGSTGGNDQTQSTIGGNGSTQTLTRRENEQCPLLFVHTAPANCS